VFVEVVLGNPGGIVTETLGVSDLLGCEAVAFGGWGGVEKAGEEGEPVEVRGRGHRGIVGLDFRQGQPVARRAPCSTTRRGSPTCTASVWRGSETWNKGGRKLTACCWPISPSSRRNLPPCGAPWTVDGSERTDIGAAPRLLTRLSRRMIADTNQHGSAGRVLNQTDIGSLGDDWP
jgi:hypothetical protein